MKIGKVIALLCVFVFSMGMITGVSAESELCPVSHALNVISSKCCVAVSCAEEREISFESADFERALNLSYVSSVTITDLPDRTDGVLYLGGSEMREGQNVSRANIGYMKFVFLGEDIDKSSFRFTANNGGHEIECMLYSLKYVNSAPNTDIGGVREVSTYKNVSLYGKLQAYDKEGDRIVFEVVKQPDNGILKVDTDGRYVYTPTKGFTGEDSFKYVALDEFGHYSNSREIELKVESQRSSLVFSDMNNDEYHVAAIYLTEKGIMQSQEVDGKHYFYPDSELGRLEYLVTVMKSMGVEIESLQEKTIFSDDSDIPANLKGYVNTATELGIISGKVDAAGNLFFAPNDKITKAEAAVILNNMCELDAPVLKPVFADSDSLPAWAAEAVYRLSYNGIMPQNNGYVSATSALERGECAQMLYMLTQVQCTK